MRTEWALVVRGQLHRVDTDRSDFDEMRILQLLNQRRELLESNLTGPTIVWRESGLDVTEVRFKADAARIVFYPGSLLFELFITGVAAIGADRVKTALLRHYRILLLRQLEHDVNGAIAKAEGMLKPGLWVPTVTAWETFCSETKTLERNYFRRVAFPMIVGLVLVSLAVWYGGNVRESILGVLDKVVLPR